MESYYLDWLNLLLRSTHVLAAMLWLGLSFYFVWLERNLSPMQNASSSELWTLQNGDFYRSVKFVGQPAQLPEYLHRFYWAGHITWLSGFELFSMVYLWQSNIYLIDPAKINWLPWQAVTLSILFLVVFWLLYDTACHLFGQRKYGDLITGLLLALLIGVASWLACYWFTARAAFLLVGATLATAMSANIAHWIIPGQRKIIAAIKAGGPIKPIYRQRCQQRNQHNGYLVLPVLLTMLSGHYSFIYNHSHSWLALLLLIFSGAALRQFIVLCWGWQQQRYRQALPYAVLGLTSIVLMIILLKPKTQAAEPNSTAVSIFNQASATTTAHPVSYQALQSVLKQRCYVCHGAVVQAKAIRLDKPQYVKQHAASIYQQTTVSKLMPLGNSTRITDAERQLINDWFKSGAPVN